MLQQRQKRGHNINNKNSLKSQNSRVIQLEINISIGKNKYLLQVQKCSNLHQQIEEFLKVNGLNAKYEGPILSMVRQQLAKKNVYQQSQCQKISQLQKIKTQIDNKRKLTIAQGEKEQEQQRWQKDSLWNNNQKSQIKYFKKQDKQNSSSQFNSRNKGAEMKQNKDSLTNKINQRQQESKCQNVYQKWKVKQKIKQKQRTKKAGTPIKLSKQKNQNRSFIKQQNKQKSKSQKKLETHEPDYFYNKGQKFKYAKEIHVQNLYKQKYPFQINRQISLTPTKKTELHQRLFKQQRVKQISKIQRQIQQKMAQKPKTPTDKYKQRVIERDNKLNQALGYLLQNKMIQNPYKIEKVTKSPFRKTNFH